MWPLWFGFSLKETRYETVFMAKVEKSLWDKETKGIRNTMNAKKNGKSLEGLPIAALASLSSSFLQIVYVPFPTLLVINKHM